MKYERYNIWVNHADIDRVKKEYENKGYEYIGWNVDAEIKDCVLLHFKKPVFELDTWEDAVPEFLFVLDDPKEYKKFLNKQEGVICRGMTESEKDAYRLGISNLYEIFCQSIEYDLEEGNYHIFIPDMGNRGAGEYDIADLIKFDQERESEVNE